VSESSPLVSIGIPTYNRPEGLARALASALAQTYPNVEIIVSDNASPVDALFNTWPPANGKAVHLIRQPTNIGAEANFCAVLEAATGEYFMWLADDDWIDPNYVAEGVAFLKQWRGYVLVAGKPIFYGAAGAFDVPSTTLEQNRPDDRVLAYYAGVGENPVFYGVARRADWLRLPIKKQVGSDWHMVAGLASLGRIKTLETTHIHRSAGGMSEDPALLAARYGLQGNHHAVIARDTVTEILWRTAVHRAIPLHRRFPLALRAYLALYERWCMWDTEQPSIKRRIELKLHRWALAWMRRSLSAGAE
jgi:glycosyltransferase involved in cell wall biosynthesis